MKKEEQEMFDINNQLIEFKRAIEEAIIERGSDGKTSVIRSSYLINLIHDAVKFELIKNGVDSQKIYPHLGETKPEIKLAGFLKHKDQDICVVPDNIPKIKSVINWGPMAFQNKWDKYGQDYTNNTLVINVRSQMSSLAKNADTLFERTFAEALNLHMKYPELVLGEVYLIPVHEYDDAEVSKHNVAFKTNKTNVEKYISFFDSINNREIGDEFYKYERCALLIVDFNQEQPRLFENNQELIDAGIISQDFGIDYSTLSFNGFVKELLSIYSTRFDINNLLTEENRW